MAVVEREVRRRIALMNGRLTPTEDTVVRTSDYSLGEAEMALAIGSIPPSQRSNWWLLALTAPLATAGIREAVRRRFFPHTTGTGWAILGTAVAGLAGGGVLLATRHHAMPRLRRDCY